MINNKYIYLSILIISSILNSQEKTNLKDYFSESSGRIFSNNSNQIILGTAALAALSSIRVDQKIKVYAQDRGLLPEKVSHFGDMYGGYWAHWIIWSSILGTSISNKEKNNFSEKLEFSTLAMITNGVITELMKRSFGRVRPNGGCCKSFPSGHTSHSFTVATIANELYGKEVGIAAYCLAALVATSRIHDNKHYLSDVIFGAGLGTAVGRGFALTYRDRINNKNLIQGSPLIFRITIPLD
tara:strand:- start:489 stop:1211 length:723 start_codon:yes stop_codon:yes gene_type:complete